MESQVKVKQSVKRSASITKQLAAEIHERATQAQMRRSEWEKQKQLELAQKDLGPCTFKPDLTKPALSRSISPFHS